MKVLKNNILSILAVRTENATYLTNLEGIIFKSLKIGKFNAKGFTEEVDFPCSFSEELQKFEAKKEIEKTQKEARAAAIRAAEREQRKEDLLNLRRWRQNKIEAFVVSTYCESAEDDYNGDVRGLTSELIFDEEKAMARFNELKGSEEPSFEQGSNGYGCRMDCYFTVELLKFYKEIPIEDRLEIMSLEELQQFLLQNSEIAECDRYAPSIEDKEWVVTFGYNRWGRFSFDTIERVDERRTVSFWSGDTHFMKQETTADLHWSQMAFTTSEFIESFGVEKAIEWSVIDKDNAAKYLSAEDYDFFFAEEEK